MKKILFPRASTACAYHNKANLRTKKNRSSKTQNEKNPNNKILPTKAARLPCKRCVRLLQQIQS